MDYAGGNINSNWFRIGGVQEQQLQQNCFIEEYNGTSWTSIWNNDTLARLINGGWNTNSCNSCGGYATPGPD